MFYVKQACFFFFLILLIFFLSTFHKNSKSWAHIDDMYICTLMDVPYICIIMYVYLTYSRVL